MNKVLESKLKIFKLKNNKLLFLQNNFKMKYNKKKLKIKFKCKMRIK